MKKIFFVLSILSIFIFTKAISDEIVTLKTTQGDIKIKLWPDIAPKASENFLKLVDSNYYDGIIFHRVIKNFMIQAGDPTATGAGGKSIWNKPFEDEIKPNITFNRKGLLAMANAGPNTNGSQFFITTKMTPWLNMKHTIFGEVIEGYDVVTKIENVKTSPYNNKPEIEQKIVKAFIEK